MFVDPKSTIPIFRQIADQLRQSIDAGVYKTGEMLPSLRAMALEIKVNPNTVQRAYDALEREGVVETRRGVGIFVASSNFKKMNAAETTLTNQMMLAIRRGVKAGLTPDAVRSAFEASMREFLARVKK